MAYYQMGDVESRFADIIWREEPVRSPELVTICEKELNWKKSTTYTVLRRLCQKGIFKNEKCVVTSLMTKDEFLAGASKTIIDPKKFMGPGRAAVKELCIHKIKLCGSDGKA